MLCYVCNRIDAGRLIDEDDYVSVQDIKHHKSLRDLRESSASCDLCKMIYNSFENQTKFVDGLPAGSLMANLSESEWTTSPILLRASLHVKDGEELGIYALKVRCDRIGAYTYLSLFIDETMVADEAWPAFSRYILGRNVRLPEQSLELVSQWLSTCESDHSECRAEPGPLPTRVIDISDSAAEEPRLKVCEAGEAANYVALSHSWGINPIIRTTSVNIEDHKHQLPLSRLPKTFRDAIAITRAMGIRFLWIDSLCIIQDDPVDWERECPRMSQVYSSAFFTIAASASVDSTGGCFLSRDFSNDIRIRCELLNRGGSGSGASGFVGVRRQLLGFRTLQSRHLHTRGWVLQERCLSRRMVHFDRDQVLWECARCRLSEDGVPADAWDTATTYWDGKMHAVYPYDNGAGRNDNSFAEDWHRLVELFSEKVFTYPDDKLPALSGVATAMEKQLGETYIAGMWRSQLPFSLLWSRAEGWLKQPNGGGFRAPSWSWAALDGKIAMASAVDFERNNFPTRAVSEIVEVSTAPLGNDKNGRLSSGLLRLLGRVRSSGPRDSTQDLEFGGRIRERIFEGGRKIADAKFDEPYQESSYSAVSGVYWLEMAVTSVGQWTALLLEPTSSPEHFRRIGLGVHGAHDNEQATTLLDYRKSWFEGTEARLITIV